MTGVVPRGRIGLRRHLRPLPADGAVVLASERGVTTLSGGQVELVVPLLDGSRDRAGVLEACPAAPERTAALLDRMDAARLLVQRRSPDEPDRSGLAYWDAAGLDGLDADRRVAAAVVAVHTVGDVPAEPVVAALRRSGTAVSTGPAAGGAAALAVVLCADYADPRVGRVAAELDRAGTPWLIARPVGERILVGPFLGTGPGRAGTGPCWTCLATRLRDNRCQDAGPGGTPLVALPSVTALAAEVVALEAAKWVAGYRHDAQTRIWEHDTLAMAAHLHAVTRLPQCPACGDPSLVRQRALRPVELSSRRKAAGVDGGCRAATAGETLRRYAHLVSPLTGVVREVRRDPRGPELLNCYRSGTNVAAGAAGLGGLRAALRSDNSGKGTTAEAAQVSALCEAVERRSGMFHGDEAMVVDSFAGLGEAAVHPNAYRLQDPRQLRDRHSWNRRHSAFQHVLAEFDERAPLPWTPVWSLTERRHRLLPTGMLYFHAPGPPSVAADSNGCAAGSSVEDAVLQGLLELVERDAVAIWWYNRLRAPGVDLDSPADPWIDALRAAYRGLGREFWVLDVTADLGVPTMVAVSRATSGPEDLLFGFGAHPDPVVAVRRALTELNQTLPAMLGMTAGRLRETGDIDLARWLDTATVANQPHLLPDPARPPRRVPDHGHVAGADLAADVDALRRRIEAADMEVLVLDQTRPDIGLPVVRVIVPGMRHYWARFAPGRLFDVPVRLGLRQAATPFAELNPLPLFL